MRLPFSISSYVFLQFFGCCLARLVQILEDAILLAQIIKSERPGLAIALYRLRIHLQKLLLNSQVMI